MCGCVPLLLSKIVYAAVKCVDVDTGIATATATVVAAHQHTFGWCETAKIDSIKRMRKDEKHCTFRTAVQNRGTACLITQCVHYLKAIFFPLHLMEILLKLFHVCDRFSCVFFFNSSFACLLAVLLFFFQTVLCMHVPDLFFKQHGSILRSNIAIVHF